jgi:dienelactone hydrolase
VPNVNAQVQSREEKAMSILRIISLLFFPFVFATACTATQKAEQAQQTKPELTSGFVNLTAADGTVLKATYFVGSQKPGPAVLLLHQCNQQRKLWDPLGESLASAGINVLTFDYRGYGESGGTPHDKLTPPEQNKIQTEMWPGDIDVAFQYLLAQPGVDPGRIGAGGASCGVDNAIKLARRHPEVKSLVLLAGPTDREGRSFVQSSDLPIFASAADDDPFGPQPLLMQWLFSVSQNPNSRFAHYTSGGHGAEMFAVQKDLPGIIATWFFATLTNKPGLAPKTNGTPLDPQILRTLALIDQTGGAGADQVEKTLSASRHGPDQPAPFPEVIVNQLGYEHIQLGDLKGAVEIMKLNVAAYPNSPNTYDSLSDAYLAAGQKDLALQNAKKAIELLPKDAAENEQRRNDVRDSAQQKINQLTQPHQ